MRSYNLEINKSFSYTNKNSKVEYKCTDPNWKCVLRGRVGRLDNKVQITEAVVEHGDACINNKWVMQYKVKDFDSNPQLLEFVRTHPFCKPNDIFKELVKLLGMRSHLDGIAPAILKLLIDSLLKKVNSNGTCKLGIIT